MSKTSTVASGIRYDYSSGRKYLPQECALWGTIKGYYIVVHCISRILTQRMSIVGSGNNKNSTCTAQVSLFL